jgi:predicted phage terminase large subunit-like protein
LIEPQSNRIQITLRDAREVGSSRKVLTQQAVGVLVRASLIQDLRADNIAVIDIDPEGDKLTRVAKISAQFAAGSVFFPTNASWLSPSPIEASKIS